MVDELMLRDVRNILDKIKVIKSRDDYGELLIKFGVSANSTEEQGPPHNRIGKNRFPMRLAGFGRAFFMKGDTSR